MIEGNRDFKYEGNVKNVDEKNVRDQKRWCIEHDFHEHNDAAQQPHIVPFVIQV